MVAYQDFVALARSTSSEERGQAAHLAAKAYLNHYGPADEHAALYAALIGFLEDPSVRVRGALAYGLLHAAEAPRPILLALLQDSPVIARAVAQHSPALIEADIIALIRGGDAAMLSAIAERERLGSRCAEALVGRKDCAVTLMVLRRHDVGLSAELLTELSGSPEAGDASLRGALLSRRDLPASARLRLVEAAARAIAAARIVAGAIAPARLQRLMRDSADAAVAIIGEVQPAADRAPYAAGLAREGRLSIRVLLHALVNGQVLFFADCIAELASTPRSKVFTILEHGSRPALNALFGRAGLGEGVRNLLVRLVLHARAADLADDMAARHFVVTALTEELIVEHGGTIPHDLEDAFSYLSEQNVTLARHAARGVMAAFAEGDEARPMPAAEPPVETRALAVA